MNLPNHETIKQTLLLNRLGSGKAVMSMIQNQVSLGEIIERLKLKKMSRGLPAIDFDPEHEMERCAQMGIRILTFWEPDYPKFLREIAGPPLVLYVAGTLLPSDQAAVAIVGTRHPSLYGLTQAKRFGRELSEKGLTIISGFAQGIDRAAHEACLEIPHGRTLAVLGCGLDVEYPKGSRRIYDRVVERGAMISEYPLGTPPMSENFPRRNRIISGLSLGVIVVEAHERSGSLITAHEAADQGREVFAVPGMIDQLTSRGTHYLLKEGANFAGTPQDVFEVLAPALSRIRKSFSENDVARILRTVPEFTGQEPPENHLSGKNVLSDAEARVLASLCGGPLAMYEISSACCISSAPAVSAVTRLELLGRIQRQSNGKFVAKQSATSITIK